MLGKCNEELNGNCQHAQSVLYHLKPVITISNLKIGNPHKVGDCTGDATWINESFD